MSKKLISLILLFTFIFTVLGQDCSLGLVRQNFLRPPSIDLNIGDTLKNGFPEQTKQNERPKFDWSKLLKIKFWTGLFTKDISKYPQPLKLDDIAKYILSFTLIAPTFTIADLFKTEFVNPGHSVLFGLAVAIGYVFLNTVFNWLTDKLPHLEWDKGVKHNISLLFGREFLNPGKHSRAMLTKGAATPLFMFLSFAVFYVLGNFLESELWFWVLTTTFFLSNYGGSYDGYMRSRQYPEPYILRSEYARNYFMTFCSILITLFFRPEPVIYLIVRRVFADVTGALIDLKGAFKFYLIVPGVKIALPYSNKVKIFENGKEEPRSVNLAGKSGFNNSWVYRKAELMSYLMKRLKKLTEQDKQNLPKSEELLKKLSQVDEKAADDNNQVRELRDLLGQALSEELGENLEAVLDAKLEYTLTEEKGLKAFAEKVLAGVETFSLTEEGIRGILQDKTMGIEDIKNKMQELEGTNYQLREKLAIACFLTKPSEEGWETGLRYNQFRERQDVKIIIINEDTAKQTKIVSETTIEEEGVFADTDTGCIIIINKKWNSKLGLLLKLERARAKLEIFTKVCRKIWKENNDKENGFGEQLVAYHNQWYRYKADPYYSRVRSLLEGWRQQLTFEYARIFFSSKEFVEVIKNEDGELESNYKYLKILGMLEDCCIILEVFSERSVLKKIKMDSYVLYQYILGFVESSGLKNQATGRRRTGIKSEEFLTELITHYSAKTELSKDIWPAITDYTKFLMDKDKISRKEKFITWLDKKVLIPKIVLPVNTILLLSVCFFNYSFPLLEFIVIPVIGLIFLSIVLPNIEIIFSVMGKDNGLSKKCLVNKKSFILKSL